MGCSGSWGDGDSPFFSCYTQTLPLLHHAVRMLPDLSLLAVFLFLRACENVESICSLPRRPRSGHSDPKTKSPAPSRSKRMSTPKIGGSLPQHKGRSKIIFRKICGMRRSMSRNMCGVALGGGVFFEVPCMAESNGRSREKASARVCRVPLNRI